MNNWETSYMLQSNRQTDHFKCSKTKKRSVPQRKDRIFTLWKDATANWTNCFRKSYFSDKKLSETKLKEIDGSKWNLQIFQNRLNKKQYQEVTSNFYHHSLLQNEKNYFRKNNKNRMIWSSIKTKEISVKFLLHSLPKEQVCASIEEKHHRSLQTFENKNIMYSTE